MNYDRFLPLLSLFTEESLEKKLWKTADKLRKNMDAAEYKRVVMGLIFLKYIPSYIYISLSSMQNLAILYSSFLCFFSFGSGI